MWGWESNMKEAKEERQHWPSELCLCLKQHVFQWPTGEKAMIRMRLSQI